MHRRPARLSRAAWYCVNKDASTHVHMNNLIQHLQQFSDCYEGDAFGLASDFEIIAGISMNDLCKKLSDEIDAHKEFIED